AVLSRLSEEEAKNVREMIPPEGLHVITATDLPQFVIRRFKEKSGTVGTPFYVRYKPGVARNDGHVLLRVADTIDSIVLPDGTHVATASRSTVFAEMIRSLERDGPLATTVSFLAVVVVVLLATSSRRGAFTVILTLIIGVTWTLGIAAFAGVRLNF